MSCKIISRKHTAFSILFFGLALVAQPILAQNVASNSSGGPSLTQQLAQLKSDSIDSAPIEKFYVVHDRHVGLAKAFEFGVGMARNFNTSIYVRSTENTLMTAFHFNDRWFAQATGSYIYNELTDSAERINTSAKIFPDTAFATKRADLTLGLNGIYGKARLTRDFMFYFDQYCNLGMGVVEFSNGLETLSSRSYVAELGVAFWFGRFSLRLGAKDHYFLERRRLGQSRVHHLLGYTTISYLLNGRAG
jgi:outer membrane beta-barrel protein